MIDAILVFLYVFCSLIIPYEMFRFLYARFEQERSDNARDNAQIRNRLTAIEMDDRNDDKYARGISLETARLAKRLEAVERKVNQ